MHRRLVVAIAGALALTGGALSFVACHQDEPAGDPKTPANSPIPEIDKKDNDPKPGPKLPSIGDAG